MSHEHSLPLELPRLVMRRTALLALAALLAIAALGLLRAGRDIRGETEGAIALAGIVAQLASQGGASDAEVLAALAAAQRERPLRHLSLRVDGADGRALLLPAPEPAVSAPMAWLLVAHRRLFPAAEAQQVTWPLAARSWRVSLIASPESERLEAIADLLTTLLLVSACIAALLAAMQWNVRRAFRPLAAIVRAIHGIERHDAGAIRALPPMPIRELQTIANAIEHLASSLERTEDERRRLGRRLMTLQEDERSRLARELHDEFGQRLTALRVDAAWLGKRAASDDVALHEVVRGMSERCAELQRDIRGLLARLRPLGPAEADGGDERPTLERLIVLLRALIDGWSQAPGRSIDYRLLALQRDAGCIEHPLDDAGASRLMLPRELMLGLYRLSQEELTNVARHARARSVELRLVLDESRARDDGAMLEWAVRDDGLGIADLGAAMKQGSGLGGMRERVWALGGELHCAAGLHGRGLALSTRLACRDGGAQRMFVAPTTVTLQ